MTAVLYAAATCVYLAYLFTHKDRVIFIAERLLFSAFALHTLNLASRVIYSGRMPVTSLHESLIFFSWLVVITNLYLIFRYKQKTLGAFVTPFALILIITAAFMPGEIIQLSPALKSFWLFMHVTIAFLGNAFFAIAFFLGVMYVIQERYLKTRKLKGLFFIMPSLDTLDELNYKFLQYGFTLLTLAIISGAVWSQYTYGSYWDWKPRQIWSVITWFLYAALLHGRLTSGWRGRTAAIFSGIAFLVLIGSFFIIRLVMGGAHGFK